MEKWLNIENNRVIDYFVNKIVRRFIKKKFGVNSEIDICKLTVESSGDLVYIQLDSQIVIPEEELIKLIHNSEKES